VVVLPAVTELEKVWLYGAASLVLYPTIQEGFGLVPFEAARAGVPCLFAAQTSLAEVLPREAARIVQWNARLSALEARRLIDDEAERRSHVETIVAAGERFTWAHTGELLMGVYEQALAAPMRPARTVLLDDTLKPVEERLPAEVQRALVAVASRPRLRRPLVGTVKAGFKAARGLRKLSRQRG
jgi:hypothetical protein